MFFWCGMHSNSLEVCIQKYCEGDEACFQELCRLLANRLLHVPIAAPVADEDDSTTVKVIEHLREEECIVPVFTTAEHLKVWSESNDHDGSEICLLGIDFCAALGGDKWLSINEASEYPIELDPIVVRRISQVSMHQAEAPQQSSYSEKYDRQEEKIDKTKNSPIDYHGKVNEKNFISHVAEAVDLHKEAVQEVESVIKAIEETEEQAQVRTRRKTSHNVTPAEVEPPRERKHTQSNISSWEDSEIDQTPVRERKKTESYIKSWEDESSVEQPTRERKKTAQEGADGAMQAWHMLRDVPVTSAAIEDKTKVMQVEINPMDLGEISKKLRENLGKGEKKKEDAKQDEKSIWDLFK